MKTRLGTARVDITPPFAVPLAGYSSRRDFYEGVFKPLYVRVWLFEQTIGEISEQRKALLVQADLIWWGSEHVEHLKNTIQRNWHIDPEFVFFHASHTHGGPQTTDRFSPLLGIMKTEYVTFLEQRVEQAVSEAHENVEVITMEKGTGICEGIAINRRKIVDGAAFFAPNREGAYDNQVTVIRCLTEEGRMKGLLFHFTCHPTTTDVNLVSSEYCGVAMEILDRTWGDGVSCFLQGCCGDIRPALYKEGQFYKGNEIDVERYGAVLAEAVGNILDKSMAQLEPALIEGWVQQADLTFQKTPLDEYTGDDAEDNEIVEIWREKLLSDRSQPKEFVSLTAQLLKLAEGFALLGMSGEIVMDYGLWIKNKTSGQVLPMGYSNGMVGYVPTAVQIKEGGYESISSGYFFDYPAPFEAEVEDRMREVIHNLIDKLRYWVEAI